MPKNVRHVDTNLRSLVISLDARFFQGQWGTMGESARYGQGFFTESLEVFDSVTIAARVRKCVNKPREDFVMNQAFHWHKFPSFQGLQQGVRLLFPLMRSAYACSEKSDIHLLRVPGIISTLIWPFLLLRGKKYGVEVIGFGRERNYKPREFSFRLFSDFFDLVTRLQCKAAVAASYVSSWEMPNLYPCKKQFYIAGARLPEAPLAEKRVYVEPPKPLKIIHVGTMHAEYKGQDVLFEALNLVQNKGIQWKLDLVGDGVYRRKLELLARKLDISNYIDFRGSFPAGLPMLRLMDEHDLMVLPSSTEGLPNVVIEAMLRGLPVIATKVGGLPELLDKEYLVPVNDHVSLAKKIIEVYENIEKLNKMSATNIKRAKLYLPERLKKMRVEFFKFLRSSTI